MPQFGWQQCHKVQAQEGVQLRVIHLECPQAWKPGVEKPTPPVPVHPSPPAPSPGRRKCSKESPGKENANRENAVRDSFETRIRSYLDRIQERNRVQKFQKQVQESIASERKRLEAGFNLNFANGSKNAKRRLPRLALPLGGRRDCDDKLPNELFGCLPTGGGAQGKNGKDGPDSPPLGLECVGEEEDEEGQPIWELLDRATEVKRRLAAEAAEQEKEEAPFNIGDEVEVRDSQRLIWRLGVVTETATLKVRPHGWKESFQWDLVRWPQMRDTLKERPVLLSPSGSVGEDSAATTGGARSSASEEVPSPTGPSGTSTILREAIVSPPSMGRAGGCRRGMALVPHVRGECPAAGIPSSSSTSQPTERAGDCMKCGVRHLYDFCPRAPECSHCGARHALSYCPKRLLAEPPAAQADGAAAAAAARAGKSVGAQTWRRPGPSGTRSGEAPHGRRGGEADQRSQRSRSRGGGRDHGRSDTAGSRSPSRRSDSSGSTAGSEITAFAASSRSTGGASSRASSSGRGRTGAPAASSWWPEPIPEETTLERPRGWQAGTVEILGENGDVFVLRPSGQRFDVPALPDRMDDLEGTTTLPAASLPGSVDLGPTLSTQSWMLSTAAICSAPQSCATTAAENGETTLNPYEAGEVTWSPSEMERARGASRRSSPEHADLDEVSPAPTVGLEPDFTDLGDVQTSSSAFSGASPAQISLLGLVKEVELTGNSTQEDFDDITVILDRFNDARPETITDLTAQILLEALGLDDEGGVARSSSDEIASALQHAVAAAASPSPEDDELACRIRRLTPSQRSVLLRLLEETEQERPR